MPLADISTPDYTPLHAFAIIYYAFAISPDISLLRLFDIDTLHIDIFIVFFRFRQIHS
jgi:hypothetical protein